MKIDNELADIFRQCLASFSRSTLLPRCKEALHPILFKLFGFTGQRALGDINEVGCQRGAVFPSDLPEIPSGGFLKTVLFQQPLPKPDRCLSAHPAFQGCGSTLYRVYPPYGFAASTVPFRFCPPSPVPLRPVPGVTLGIWLLRELCHHGGFPL